MNQVIENFLERPLSHKIGFWVGSLGILTFLFWQYAYSGLSEEVGKLSDKVDTLNAQITHEQRLARNLGKFRKEVADLEVKLRFVLQELPDKREIPDLLASISNLARDAGLEVNLFRPNPENMKDFYAEVPVSISVEGSYHQIATFFDEVGKLSRIVNVNEIIVREPKVTDEKVLVKSDSLITTFRYLDESERIKPAAKSQTDKKRRKK